MTEARTGDGLAGRLLAGRYRLDALIASGGMAQVWEATDRVLTRPVAVKILHAHLAADDTFVERFRREAIAAARLAHPSIVAIYDTCSENGMEAIVMELVRGTTLRHLLDERRTLDASEAVGVIGQVADALDVAHKAGVVHRDVKPANILLSNDGRVLVADFGIAKAAEVSDLTGTGTTLGTVKYLSPEQVEGANVDARTDVYALGVVLYECLCGRPPFVADTEAATALARLHQEPMRPRNVKASVPKPI
ncbi:MAG: protein kinase, partial [Acidimicrobiales bacterium]